MGFPRDMTSETKRNDALADLQISAWEAVLNEERATTTAGATAAQDLALAEFESSRIESHWTGNEDLIPRGVKSAVKELVANILSTRVRESVEDIL